MEKRTWAQCLSTVDLISELRIRAEDQRTEAALAVRKDDRCSPQAGSTYEDLADLLDEAAVRLENSSSVIALSDKEYVNPPDPTPEMRRLMANDDT